MKTSLYFLLFPLLFLLPACEKTITLNLNDTAPKLVIEATIENGGPPMVVLSKSMDYFSNISPAILQNSFVHNAEVDISNGTLTHKLKEYKVDFGSGYYGYYYSTDSSNLSSAFVGELNHGYSLHVIAEGKE